MSRRSNYYVLLTMVAGILVTACAMIVAVFIASQRPSIVIIQAAGSQGTPPAPAITSLEGARGADAGRPAGPPQLLVARVAAAPATTDPFDKAWDKVTPLEVALQPQMQAMPMLETPTVRAVVAQAVRDSGRIVWRLSWPAPKPSHNVDAARFCDAVAMQFAPGLDTSYMMGGPGKPVRILHWKAVWQKDVDSGFQDVQDLHPNYWADMYWFSEGKFPFPVTEAFKNPVARQWLVASQAGNPMADYQRRQPVEEIIAEGLGTATHVPATISSARGAWKDGRWTVVIDRPLAADDPLSRLTQAAQAPVVSLAVWDGSANNVGGRKHFCTWLAMKVEP